MRADTWSVEHQVEGLAEVSRLVLSADGALLWALTESGVAVIDTQSLAIVDLLEVPGRALDLVLSADDGEVFVTFDRSVPGEPEIGSGLAVFDARRRVSLGQLATAPSPTGLAYSRAAGAAWVSHGDGTVLAVDLDPARQPRVRHELHLGSDLEAIAFEPAGRLAFLVAPGANLVHIVDAAHGRLVKSGPMAGGPDQVAFSGELAYVRHRDSEHVLMLPLDSAGAVSEPIQAADFPAGRQPHAAMTTAMASRPAGENGPGSVAPSPSRVRAPSMVRAPGANAMVVANAADEAIYFYMEGMAAPMGHFKNQGRRPEAVLVLDRSLREARPGVYQTFAHLEGPGTYDVAIFLDAPRLIHCFAVEVAPPESPVQSPRPQIRLAENGARRGADGRLDLVLTVDPADQAPTLETLSILAVRTAGGWHKRFEARALGHHRYGVSFEPGPAGDYLLWAETAADGLLGGDPILHIAFEAEHANPRANPGATP